MQPQKEAGMNGQSGLSHKWCVSYQAECINHAIPMNQYDRSPA